MKKTIISLLCLFSQTVFCQNSFTKFIARSSVQWAADATDTVHFKSPDLSLLLRERLHKGALKVAITEGLTNSGKVDNVSKEAILERIAPNRVKQLVDENGNLSGTTIEAENPLFSTTYFDSLVNDLVEIPQILYVQSGLLKSYVPWVSPKYAVSTSWGQRLGIANAFSTAFNSSPKICARHRKNAVSLGISSRMVTTDSTSQLPMIKQLYAQSLLQALWPSLNTKHYQVIRLDSLSVVPFEKINRSLLDDASLNIPLYDADGNISNKTVTVAAEALNAAAFTNVALVQEWFYQAKQNKLFSRIQHLLLYAYKIKNGQAAPQAVPVLKIMLK